MMKSIFIGFLLAATVLSNLFFCFYIGNRFIDVDEWYLVPGIISLFVWFFFVAFLCDGMADKLSSKVK